MFKQGARRRSFVLGSLLLAAVPVHALPAWSPTGNMIAARYSHTATLMQDGRVLVAGGRDTLGIVNTVEIFDTATAQWGVSEPPFPIGADASSTLLLSGEVLVCGGEANPTGRCALFNSSLDAWLETSAFPGRRWQHTATLLRDGRVLVAGGLEGAGAEATGSLLYSRLSEQWTPTAALDQPRTRHTASLLASGEVLIVGGEIQGGAVRLASVERYDPDTETWSPADAMPLARSRHTATGLVEGRVLVVGGWSGGGSSLLATHAFDPTVPFGSGQWSSAGGLLEARSHHVASLLPNGSVVVAGGEDSPGLSIASAEIFEPLSGSWSAAEPLPARAKLASGVLLPNGALLFTGGRTDYQGFTSSSQSVTLDLSSGSWQYTDSLAVGRHSGMGLLLSDGRALTVAGGAESAATSVEIFDPVTELWGLGAPMPQAGFYGTATLLPSGKVLVVNGGIGDSAFPETQLYDPDLDSWSSGGFLDQGRQTGTATLLADGRVLVAGGAVGSILNVSSAEIWDPNSNDWTPTGSMNEQRYSHSATLLASGRVLVTGGSRTAHGALYEVSTTAEIYDPRTGVWSLAGGLLYPRASHHGVLLRSGEVLIIGGTSNGGEDAPGSEIYDPETGTSVLVDFSGPPRTGPIASLPADRVFFAGAQGVSGFFVAADLFDGSSRTWTERNPPLETRNRYVALSTRLLSNEILVAGGWVAKSSSEIFDPYVDVDPSRRPEIESAPQAIQFGEPWTIEGEFVADTDSNGGSGTSSASSLPLVLLEAMEGSAAAYLIPDPITPPIADPVSLTISTMPPIFNPGWHRVTVIVNGIPSVSKVVSFQCSLEITEHPGDVEVFPGETATFSVSALGGRFFQWQRCVTGSCAEGDWLDVPGATEPLFTTDPTIAGDAGARYRAVVDSGCMQTASNSAVLNLGDEEEPTAEVESPSGGEYWLLSEAGAVPRTELVTWSMADNVRICDVRVSLRASNNGGVDYFEVSAGGGLPATFGSQGVCPFPGVTTTSVAYTVPEAPPSGATGSLYKIQVEVTDHLGNTLVLDPGSGENAVRSARPFYIVEPNPDSVRTLIVSNVARMVSFGGIGGAQAAALTTKLNELAGHPRVLGVVLDLSNVTDIEALYDLWDADLVSATPDPEVANLVLFGCQAPLLSPCTEPLDGIHDFVRELVSEVFTGVENVVVVGGDEIIPFARLVDRATLLPELTYLFEDNLTAASTVGLALANDLLLSDDPLVTMDPVSIADLSSDLFVPDLALGRLVETPQEIIATIANFISRDGVVDLPEIAASSDDHRVLVNGYDFLTDSAKRIRERWRSALGDVGDPDTSLAPVDGTLMGGDWNLASSAQRKDALRAHLDGNGDGGGGGRHYSVASLNGHASHYEEGVPGTSEEDIDGLSALEIAGEDACTQVSSSGALDLSGSIVYSVGCHGGLTVSNGCSTDLDHSLDLVQSVLRSGALAYVGNTGYGWGLKLGSGYSERLAEILTEELTRGGTVSIGEALRDAKQRYVLETPRFDGYAAKTVQQWTLYGLPMVALKTGISAAGPEALQTGESSVDGASDERLGPVTVRRRLLESAGSVLAALPSHLTRVDLTFDFTAPGVYRKYAATGDEITGTPGCPDSLGCYYTLNGLAELSTGASDLPVQPYFVYDSRLAGTSQHGVLWKGGSFDQEGAWKSVVAELASNGGDGSNHGVAPRTKMIKNIGTRWLPGEDPPTCRPSDLELNSTVVVAGESLKSSALLPGDDLERIYRGVDLEALYFNDTTTPGANCDREGPVLEAGPFGGSYHQADGPVVSWSVPATDAEGEVWRVVVVYTDNEVDVDGHGQWLPLELEDGDDNGSWTGSQTFAEAARITYVIQAVDTRGNVTWLDWKTSETVAPEGSTPSACIGTGNPSSGVELGIACPVDVPISLGAADLAVSVVDSPDPVATGDALNYTVLVTNLGPSVAHGLEVAVELPSQYAYLGGLGTGWSCTQAGLIATCSRAALAVGSAPSLTLVGSAPGSVTTLTLEASVTSLESDGVAGNDSEVETTQVVLPLSADLSMTKSVDFAQAMSGKLLTYTLAVTNNGPDDIGGAWITDSMPAGLSEVSWSCTATAGSHCSTSGIGNIADEAALLSGGTVTYVVRGIVEQTSSGAMLNEAMVQPPARVTDPLGNNDDDAMTAILPSIFGDGLESGYLNRWSYGAPCAHSVCTEGSALSLLCSSCAAAICSQSPACCSSAWGSGCVALVSPVCGLSCP